MSTKFRATMEKLIETFGDAAAKSLVVVVTKEDKADLEDIPASAIY
jgi:hypothetical protein